MRLGILSLVGQLLDGILHGDWPLQARPPISEKAFLDTTGLPWEQAESEQALLLGMLQTLLLETGCCVAVSCEQGRLTAELKEGAAIPLAAHLLDFHNACYEPGPMRCLDVPDVAARLQRQLAKLQRKQVAPHPEQLVKLQFLQSSEHEQLLRTFPYVVLDEWRVQEDSKLGMALPYHERDDRGQGDLVLMSESSDCLIVELKSLAGAGENNRRRKRAKVLQQAAQYGERFRRNHPAARLVLAAAYTDLDGLLWMEDRQPDAAALLQLLYAGTRGSWSEAGSHGPPSLAQLEQLARSRQNEGLLSAQGAGVVDGVDGVGGLRPSVLVMAGAAGLLVLASLLALKPE